MRNWVRVLLAGLLVLYAQWQGGELVRRGTLWLGWISLLIGLGLIGFAVWRYRQDQQPRDDTAAAPVAMAPVAAAPIAADDVATRAPEPAPEPDAAPQPQTPPPAIDTPSDTPPDTEPPHAQ